MGIAWGRGQAPQPWPGQPRLRGARPPGLEAISLEDLGLIRASAKGSQVGLETSVTIVLSISEVQKALPEA